MINKYIATAKIVNPSLVSARAAAEGFIAHPGSIFVSIPEMGFEEPNLIYCRYGLSFPFIKIQKDWRIWVEPTIDDDSRFCFTGIVDCGPLTPVDADQLLIQLASQVIYASTAGTMHLSKKTATEPFVLGSKFLTWLTTFINTQFNLHTHICAAPGVASAVPVPVSTPPTDILSTKVFGE